MMKEFIKSNYENAIKIQNGFEHDRKMIESIKSDSLNTDMVKKWMQSYGLFQGINNEIRIKIANEFIKFAQNNYKQDEIDIKNEFQKLLSNLYNVHPRKWLSATSKLLWCMHPNQIVIYDAFVERVITVYQCLDKKLAKQHRINNCPTIKTENDIKLVTDFYMNYQNLVKILLDEHQNTFNNLKKKYKSSYDYDIRILDKLLWIMGSMNSEFEFGEITCKIQ